MSSPVRRYAGGRFDASGVPFPLVDPVTGRTASVVPEASRELIDRAVGRVQPEGAVLDR
ncbi:hypothetical protein AB0C94_30995 [Streptomyces griseus]|uniref:hypothetical protein n=1 Tax=Streptomyces griseus TaxID=1911 RepID=UPI0033B29EA6